MSIQTIACLFVAMLSLAPSNARATELGTVGLYEVLEITFAGHVLSAKDTPRGRSILRHLSARKGKGGTSGDVFKVRFCPTKAGMWTLDSVESSDEKLRGQKQGDARTATESKQAGFWLIDTDSAGSRWYKKSNGRRPYIFGNTHYSFLSGHREGGKPSNNDIAAAVCANSEYFNKLRFALHGDRYPDPRVKPYSTTRAVQLTPAIIRTGRIQSGFIARTRRYERPAKWI